VLASILNPVGRAPAVTANAEAAPPVTVGELAVIAELMT